MATISSLPIDLLSDNRDHHNSHAARTFKFPPDSTDTNISYDLNSDQGIDSATILTNDKSSPICSISDVGTSEALVNHKPVSNPAQLQSLYKESNFFKIPTTRLNSIPSSGGVRKVLETRRRVPDDYSTILKFEQLSTATTTCKDDTDLQPVKATARNKTTSTTKSVASLTKGNHQTNVSNMTFWNYLLVELQAQPVEGLPGKKAEILVNFVKVPIHVEKVILFGSLACLDSFLHFFTILPLRFLYALYALVKSVILTCTKGVTGFPSSASRNNRLPMSRKADILKGFIFVLTIHLLLQLDTSKIYHNIRGQSAIRLYVVFSVLEISDKLLSALGQDILECIFSHKTLSRHYKDGAHKYYKPVLFAMLAVVYVFFHSLVILYQIITLNVAVNSYSNALLTLLLSNQFSEIKSAVFKKFERENLFQLTCADITERFQLTAMLFIIGMRNVVEVSNTGLVPRSWAGWNRWLGAMFGPMFVVVGSEVCVDWLKHAYISKFNNINSRVYDKFLDVLAFDYSENALSDYIMTKRFGLPVFPIASVFIRMLFQSYSMLATQAAQQQPIAAKSEISWFAIDTFISLLWLLLLFIILFMAKLTLGLFLLQYSYNRAQMVNTDNTKQPLASALHSTTTMLQPSESFSPKRSKIITSITGNSKISNNYNINKTEKDIDDGDEADFVPGLLKGGQGVVEIPEHLRVKLYDLNIEKVPPPKQRKSKIWDYRDLLAVKRFKMAAKQIW